MDWHKCDYWKNEAISSVKKKKKRCVLKKNAANDLRAWPDHCNTGKHECEMAELKMGNKIKLNKGKKGSLWT